MKQILLGLVFTLATLALVLIVQLSPGRVEAQGNGQCVEVPAPDPIQFERRVGWLTHIKATYQWQETSPGEWTLFIDVSPFGNHEKWMSNYPNGWKLRKPVDLPQHITEVNCPDPEPDDDYQWSDWSECSVSCGGGIQTRTCEPVDNGHGDKVAKMAIKQPYCPDDEDGGGQRACNPQSCEEPTGGPSVTPVPEEPTPTSGPVSTRWSSLGYNANCQNSDIEVTFDTKREDGSFEEKVKVAFKYQGTEKTAETNNNGRATVMYGKNGDGAVTAVADGYPSQSTHMIMPQGCPAVGGQVLGASTGQVLGATSYAKTGTSAQSIFTVAQLVGMLLVATGTAWYVKASLKA